MLDTILVDAAVEASVELRTGVSVQELLWDGDRVVGIRGQVHGGGIVTEHTPVIIGADGMHSIVARCVDAPVYNAHPT